MPAEADLSPASLRERGYETVQRIPPAPAVPSLISPVGPSTILDSFQTTIPSDNLQQPQSYLVYYPEGKIVWNTMRLDSRLRYRVIYTYGYPVPPDFIRDLTSIIVAIDVLTFWGSQLGIAEALSMMKKRLEEKKFRLEARASQRPAAAVG